MVSRQRAASENTPVYTCFVLLSPSALSLIGGFVCLSAHRDKLVIGSKMCSALLDKIKYDL